MCFGVYNIIRYRRKIVATNLRNSFPQKSEAERKAIEKKYYKHLCDMCVEVIHILHASPNTARKMANFKNIELVNNFYNQGKSVIVAAGHYKPQTNKNFEHFINTNRERFGCIPVCMYDIARTAIKMNNNQQPFFLALFADQTPASGEIRYWTNFLNQDTPVFLGTEKIARKTKQPVLFCNVYKPYRGHYEVEFEVLTDNPADTSPNQITELHVHALERLITQTPELWLWSHRRWKRKRNHIA